MGHFDTSQGGKIKVLLSDEELQLPAIDDLFNKYIDWVRLSKETQDGRKTRSSNKKADLIYNDIMNFELPPIKLTPTFLPDKITENNHKIHSVDTSVDSDSDSASSSSRPMTRSLRARCRTPTQKQQPSTPSNQRLRANLKRNLNTGDSGSGGSSVLSAALNQQHPSVSVTKIRQLLRADSAQKRKEEEKDRQHRLMLERKAKEEKAEAIKREMLEKRAATAKLKREERLMHAAEVRRAREEAKRIQKKAQAAERKVESKEEVPMEEAEPEHQPEPEQESDQTVVDPPKPINETIVKSHNATFKKPIEDRNNIDISIQDETADEQKGKASAVAEWAKMPHLREALVKQFSQSEVEILREAKRIFSGVHLPVDLNIIFGPSKAVTTRYLCRTSSAVWSPPNRSMKRSSSMVLTPSTSKH